MLIELVNKSCVRTKIDLLHLVTTNSLPQVGKILSGTLLALVTGIVNRDNDTFLVNFMVRLCNQTAVVFLRNCRRRFRFYFLATIIIRKGMRCESAVS